MRLLRLVDWCGEIGGVRVTRCFAFIDLSGFTAYTHAEGDTAAVSVLAHLRGLLRAEAEHLGVRVTKWLGDGAMLSGVDTEAVMTCVLRVRDRVAAEGALPLRGGICAGPVIMFEGDDYIGEAVNLAARLCAAAAPGQILTAATAIEDNPAAFSSRELPLVEVAGVPMPVSVHDLRRAL
jgi:adenylate cyclase